MLVDTSAQPPFPRVRSQIVQDRFDLSPKGIIQNVAKRPTMSPAPTVIGRALRRHVYLERTDRAAISRRRGDLNPAKAVSGYEAGKNDHGKIASGGWGRKRMLWPARGLLFAK